MLKLQAAELSKSYRGRKVVDNVSLEIRQGEVVGLLGPNGAGKTTTFYILVGLARPERDQLPTSGTFCLSQADRRGQFARGAGNAADYSRAAPRPRRGIAGAVGLGGPAAQQGICVVGRGATPAGNRALAGDASFVCAARRAVFRNRSADGDGFAENYHRFEHGGHWSVGDRSQRAGDAGGDESRIHHPRRKNTELRNPGRIEPGSGSPAAVSGREFPIELKL